jgi:hypothetical protein
MNMVISQETIEEVWRKARGVTEQNAEVWRKDECGAWMKRDHYGQAHSEFGWKIENISSGGPDILENLRPFHCANTYDHANGRAKCRFTTDQTAVPVQGHIREPRNRKA